MISHDVKRSNPDRYFGSDLNKFIHEECGKKMIVNNIDLIMLKHRLNKNDILRVIESKHTMEKPMNEGQKIQEARYFYAQMLNNIVGALLICSKLR